MQTTYRTQAKALLLKNAAQQRRSWLANLLLVATPILFCVLLFILQRVINNVINNNSDNQCGCFCLSCCTSDINGDATTNCTAPADGYCTYPDICTQTDPTRCGLSYSNADQSNFCAIPNPSIWPAIFQVPSPGFLAFPWNPNAAIPYTGEDEDFAASLASQLFENPVPTQEQQAEAIAFLQAGQALGNASNTPTVYAGGISYLGIQLGTFKTTNDFYGLFVEPAFFPTDKYNGTLYNMLANASDPTANVSTQLLDSLLALASSNDPSGSIALPPADPLTAEPVWQANADDINSLLYCGYRQARCDSASIGETQGFAQAYDFQNSSSSNFNIRMWWNATGRYGDAGQSPTEYARVNAGLNAASNAWLRTALGRNDYPALLVGLMEMPKPQTRLTLDFSSLLGPLFYTWVLQLLLPVMLVSLVYEKEHKLRTIMKMHGLGDRAYWSIQYVWFFLINFVYSWVLIGFGSLIDLAFFRLTQYSFQFVFYLLWVNCLIAFAFLLSTLFRSTRTAVVVAFLYVFGTGLVGYLLIQQFIASNHWWVVFFELVPGFGLYAGLWEISQYAFRAAYQGSEGMTWSKLGDPNNQVPIVMIIFAVEWIVFMAAAWYLEQVIPTGIGIPRHPLFFLGKNYKYSSSSSKKKALSTTTTTPSNGEGELHDHDHGQLALNMEPADVSKERQRTEALLEGGRNAAVGAAAIIIKDLSKTFPPLSRNAPKKVAVESLTMAVSRGECFGLLGPNGAGKSTTINILTGFLTPTSGTAHIMGHDITTSMQTIHQIMGVCPQDNLLWETLTAREHLFFYGRLKNLRGRALASAVESALKSVNLYYGGVADKQVKKYSGGMKRRLSVAISFMGDPLVVYLDEPSTVSSEMID